MAWFFFPVSASPAYTHVLPLPGLKFIESGGEKRLQKSSHIADKGGCPFWFLALWHLPEFQAHFLSQRSLWWAIWKFFLLGFVFCKILDLQKMILSYLALIFIDDLLGSPYPSDFWTVSLVGRILEWPSVTSTLAWFLPLNVGESVNMMGMTSVIITWHGKGDLHMQLMLLNQLTFFLSTDYLRNQWTLS